MIEFSGTFYSCFYYFCIILDGEIKIFIENRDEPLATYKDQNLIQVKYFGFASYDNYLAKFFYNCAGENTYSSNEIENSCRFYESWENEYKEFFKITDIPRIRPEGYLIKFPVYIQATKDAHVLLSPRAADDRADDVYEIRKFSRFVIKSKIKENNSLTNPSDRRMGK